MPFTTIAAFDSTLRKTNGWLDAIVGEFRDDPDIDVQQVARAVFRVIGEHVTPGEVGDVRQSLPYEIRALWPSSLDYAEDGRSTDRKGVDR